MVTREVLVIDDDTLTRWSLTQVLARAGYRVRAAASGAEGLAHAAESRPDLVLLDLHLGDTCGDTVLPSLRGAHPGLPVVMMGADATPEAVRYLCGLGARGFLAKPCAASLLYALVAVLIA